MQYHVRKMVRLVHEVIQFEKVSFRYPDEEKWILEDLSFSVQRGERVVITGPSGCGKTTLLFLSNRLYPDNCDGILSGSVKLFGRDSLFFYSRGNKSSSCDSFSRPGLTILHANSRRRACFYIGKFTCEARRNGEKDSEVLALTDLTEFRHAVIQKLSGGQKQRIATACAIIMEPEVLLLDEPLSHLDPYTANKYVEWLDELQQKQAMTIVAIEHRLDLWGDFFERSISLNKNEVDPNLEKRRSSKKEDASLVVNKVQTNSFLQETTFALNRGEIAVLAGPNGSGKSTLLKALSQLIPSSGTVQPKFLGYVPQSPEFLFLTKSVRDEVGFGGGNNVEDMMTRLQLLPIADSHPFAVSHGQKRRVAIAAMLTDGREVILMDEPTSGQDAKALSELFQLIDERAQEGTTFLIVTHDMEFAYCLADSILLMNDGLLTGKFEANELWGDEQLLLDHHLLPPKGMMLREECLA